MMAILALPIPAILRTENVSILSIQKVVMMATYVLWVINALEVSAQETQGSAPMEISVPPIHVNHPVEIVSLQIIICHAMIS
jgi:hypothetical protein